MAKLIAIDIDGTLLNSNNQIDDEVKRAIFTSVDQQKRIVLCTGKSCEEIKKIQHDLQLNTIDNYVIANDGIVISSSRDKKILKKNMISYHDFLEISEVLDQVGLHYHVKTKSGILTPNQEVDKYTKYDGLISSQPIQVVDKEEVQAQEIYKLMIAGEPDYLNERIPEIPKKLLARFSCNDQLFCFKELLNKNANKGSALAFLAQYLKISLDETMAIGDSYNDLSMFKQAKISVAMGNANNQVKREADYITDSNDQQGVAKALYQWA